MEEQEYIELDTLLAKLRVNCLRKIGNKNTETTAREKNYKLVRNIDNIKRQIKNECI